MNAQEKEIVVLYEDHGLSVEDISLESGLEPLAVKGCLYSYSKAYRESIESPSTPPPKDSEITIDVEEHEHKMIGETLKALAFHSEDDKVRLKACMYLHEERTGRNKKKAERGASEALGAVKSVFALNEQILKARAIIKQVQQSALEVPSEVSKA